MTDVYERLGAAGVVLTTCPSPVSSYAPGMIYGRRAYNPERTPTRDGALVYKKKVGVDSNVEGTFAADRSVAPDCLLELEVVCGHLRRVENILKVDSYVAAEEPFEEQPAVVNGASDLMGETSTGVHSLPGRAPVEIEPAASLRAEAVAEEER